MSEEIHEGDGNRPWLHVGIWSLGNSNVAEFPSGASPVPPGKAFHARAEGLVREAAELDEGAQKHAHRGE